MPTTRALLLDTHAGLWWGTGRKLSAASRKAIERAARRQPGVYLSPITAWEAARLARRGRLRLPLEPLIWFRSLLAQQGFALLHLSPEILIEAVDLPGTPPDDPADRFLIATARQHGLRLVTRDTRILDYGASGHVLTLEC
jgi:PIN domain nuclease of toxin-antitoxin system